MQIDTAGTYLLKYTAEDECGNVTEVTREVVAEVPPTYRTVLYTDGTFIINESSRDQAANEALHGAATNVYNPWVEQGTPIERYAFSSVSQRPWNSVDSQIQAVEIGSAIRPAKTDYWFRSCGSLKTVDLKKADLSSVNSMANMFYMCGNLKTIEWPAFDASQVTNLTSTFYYCSNLESIDVSEWKLSKATDMTSAFSCCSSIKELHFDNASSEALTNVKNAFGDCSLLEEITFAETFVLNHVTDASDMFSGCGNLTELDLSNMNFVVATNMQTMFAFCTKLKTIYTKADPFAPRVPTARGVMMFRDCTSIVGGAGTTYNSSEDGIRYARIDNPPDAPGYFTLKPSA